MMTRPTILVKEKKKGESRIISCSSLVCFYLFLLILLQVITMFNNMNSIHVLGWQIGHTPVAPLILKSKYSVINSPLSLLKSPGHSRNNLYSKEDVKLANLRLAVSSSPPSFFHNFNRYKLGHSRATTVDESDVQIKEKEKTYKTEDIKNSF